MDKLIIPKYKQRRTACASRIKPEQYQRITELSEDSGQSIQFVIDKLLDFALDNCEVENDQ